MPITIPIKRWIIVCAITFATIAPVSAGVNFSTSVEPFELGIDIEHWTDVRRAMSSRGPYHRGLKQRAWGTAQDHFKWQYEIKRDAKKCSMSNLNIDVRVVLQLPQWLSKYASTDGAQDVFACVSQTVTTHENRHAQIWRETAHRMYDGAMSRMNMTSCHNFRKRAYDLFLSLRNKGYQRQKVFDAADYKRPRYDKCWRTGQLASKSASRVAQARRPTRHAVKKAAGGPDTSSVNSQPVENSVQQDNTSISGYMAGFGIAIVLACGVLGLFVVRAIARNSQEDGTAFDGDLKDAWVDQANNENRSNKLASSTRRDAAVPKRSNKLGQTTRRVHSKRQGRSFGLRN